MGMVRSDLLSWWAFGDALVSYLLESHLFYAISYKQIPPKPMFEKAKTIAFTGNRKLTSKDGRS
ncbi:MAG: hypothetical protein SNJ29_14210, partial [Rikenellaceae bacterium]